MGLRASLATAAVAAGGIFLSAASPQRPQATFRSDINYVEVDVVVTDAQGRFVSGLTAADFEIVDAGRKQKVDVFREIDVPVERADRPLFASGAIAPDVFSNATVADGRVYVLLLDDLHTAPSNTNEVKRRAREFVETYLGSNDLAAVLHASGRTNVSQDFTSNRALLLAAIDGFMGRSLKSAAASRVDDFNAIASQGRMNGEPRPARDNEARERLFAARGTFLTIRDLANHLATLSGRRKAMLLFSEGVDIEGDTLRSIEAQSQFADMQEVREAMLEAVAAATRANVHIYSVDASAMATGSLGAEISTIPHGEREHEQAITPEGPAHERRRAQGTLRTISDQTGAIPIVNTNNFAEGFSRIQRENSTYYLLGFYPAAKPDGKFHRLQVRALKPGLQVRARAGYHATRAVTAADTPDAEGLRDLMTAPVPTSGLALAVTLPVFKHSARQSVVMMAIDVAHDALRFESQGDTAAEDLVIVYQVLDPAANVIMGESQRVEMRLSAGTRQAVEDRGFRAVFPLTLGPGRYQVRVAARTQNGARRGSAFADLVVPDFFSPPLIWSGVSMTSTIASAVPTRPADGDMSKLIPIMPAAVRTFTAADALAVYAEAYDNDTRAPHDVDLTVTVRDDAGKVVFTSADHRSSSELAGRRGGYGLSAGIPLTGLAPGAYVLTLTARSRASGNATATRDIPFAIS